MNINITEIVTVRMTHGGDTTYLSTELPNGVWPFTGSATVTLNIARGQAEEYVKNNFPGVPHKIIEG